MKPDFQIYRAHDLAPEIEQASVRLTAAVVRASELLRQPVPDTFLGRRHYELIKLPAERE